MPDFFFFMLQANIEQGWNQESMISSIAPTYYLVQNVSDYKQLTLKENLLRSAQSWGKIGRWMK